MTITYADHVDSIYARYESGEISFDDALRELEQMGLDPANESVLLAALKS